MNHIHIEIKPGAVATFSQEPTKETLEAVKKLIEAAEKKLNEPEERYYELIDDDGYCDDFVKGKIYPLSDPLLTEFGHKLPIKHSIDWRLRTKQDYLNQEAKKEIIEEKKPLFEFEGHKYYRDSEMYFFMTKKCQENSNLYDIEKVDPYSIMLGDQIMCNEAPARSKIFPTKEQCQEALFNHIWDNHKISEKERELMGKEYGKIFLGISWKQFYCETIIKQQNK